MWPRTLVHHPETNRFYYLISKHKSKLQLTCLSLSLPVCLSVCLSLYILLFVSVQTTGQGGEGLKMVPKRQIHLKKKNKTKEINDKEKNDKLQVLVCLCLFLSLPVCLSLFLSLYLSVCLSHYTTRWYWRMNLLKGEQQTEMCQPMNCSIQLSIIALICCYDNTVCPLPSTHVQWPVVMSTAAGSTGAWLQEPVQVTTPDVIRELRLFLCCPRNDLRWALMVCSGLFLFLVSGLLIGGQSVVQRRLQKSVSLDETKTKMASCIIKSVLSKKMQVEKINTKTSYLKKKLAASPIVPSEGAGLEAGPGVFKVPVHSVRDVRSLVKNTYSLSFSTATTPDKLKPATFKVVGQEDSPPPTYQQAVGVKGHSTRGHVSKVTASFSQSRDRKQYNALSHPITQQRQGSEPIISRRKDATISQLERAEGASHQAGASLPFSAPPSPSSSRHPQVDQQEQLPPQGASSHSVPAPLQRLQTCFYTPSQHPQLRKVSYIPNPLNSIQNPQLHQSRSPGDTLDQTMKSCPSPATRRTADNVSAVTPPTLKNKQQQPFRCSFQSFLPAQVSNDFLIDITGSAVTPGAVFSGPAPCHMMLEPNGRYCYMDTHPQHHRKLLLDPETGQFIQVFLPGASPAPNTMFPMCCFNPAPTVINPTPTILQTSNVNRAVLSVMRFQPTLYAAPCLPVPLHTHTSPWYIYIYIDR